VACGFRPDSQRQRQASPVQGSSRRQNFFHLFPTEHPKDSHYIQIPASIAHPHPCHPLPTGAVPLSHHSLLIPKSCRRLPRPTHTPGKLIPLEPTSQSRQAGARGSSFWKPAEPETRLYGQKRVSDHQWSSRAALARDAVIPGRGSSSSSDESLPSR